MCVLYRVLTWVSVLLFVVIPTVGMAVDSDDKPDSDSATSVKSLEQLSREMSNPLAAVTSLSYRFEHKTFQGDLPEAVDQTSTSHVFEAVIPFRQKNGKGFVFRFSLPYMDDEPIFWVDRGYPEWLIRQQDPTLQGEGYWNATHGHTGDVIADIVYGGVSDDGFILQYGLASRLPTSSDTSNARQQFILGPEINVGKMTNWGSYGAIFSHVIDLIEKTDKGTPDTSMTTIDAYFSYEMNNGWQLYSRPKITYDWEGDSGNKLSIPLGAGIAKTTRLGSMPLKISAEIQKFVVSTERFSSDWFFQLTVTPLLPNKYTRN